MLRDKDYRHAYFDELLNVSIATQIKVLREQSGRGWSQQDLADRVGMKQPRISVMENVNYSSWSINTLRKLAEAFDLRLRVSFESFGSGIKEMEQINREALERPLFEEDPYFKPQPITVPCQIGGVGGVSLSLNMPAMQKESQEAEKKGKLYFFDGRQKVTEVQKEMENQKRKAIMGA